MKKFTIISTILLIIAVIMVGVSLKTPKIQAQIPTDYTPLMGWMWSSNIGWVSMNSANPSAIPVEDTHKIPYSVEISTSTGAFKGYAWSPNIGWISFQSADANSYCGSGSSARANLDTGLVNGYIVALSGGTGGWDGCIRLSGDKFASPWITALGEFTDQGKTFKKSGVTYWEDSAGNIIKGLFGGFAWDSTNLGWLSFEPTVDSTVTVCIPGNPRCPPVGGPDFIVGGNSITINKSDATTVNTIVAVGITEANTADQQITMNLGSIHTNLSVSLLDNLCIINSSNLSCNIPITVTLKNTGSPLTDYKFNVVGTRSDGTTREGIVDVKITDSSVSPGPITLRAHKTNSPSDSGKSDITIRKGSDAYLTWSSSGLGDYDGHCKGVVLSGTLEPWDNLLTENPVRSISNPFKVEKNELDFGKYDLKLVCTHPDSGLYPQKESNVVTIKVTIVGEEEI